MNGTITTWFKDKGFGFIKDENGDNRYFHVIKVANPELIKKDAAVTFEPTTNNKGLSAYAVKVVPDSKYIYIAGERLKLTAIKSRWCIAKKCRLKLALIKKMRCCPSAR